MLKTYSKGKESYKSNWENVEEKGKYLQISKIGNQVPTWRFLILN